MCVCISGHKGAVAVQQRKDISLYVPFWMTAGAILYVTRERFVSLLPERFAYLLTFFAGY